MSGKPDSFSGMAHDLVILGDRLERSELSRSDANPPRGPSPGTSTTGVINWNLEDLQKNINWNDLK